MPTYLVYTVETVTQNRRYEVEAPDPQAAKDLLARSFVGETSDEENARIAGVDGLYCGEPECVGEEMDDTIEPEDVDAPARVIMPGRAN